jgi:peptidoglycan/xylan/chitin deacetylase (PgdA/CDA1 family)
MSAFRSLKGHLYQNFVMPDRLEAFRKLLREIAGKGYRFITVDELASAIKAGRAPDSSLCILRVDIDSDPAGAGRMFDIARAEGICATYYFRLATLDRRLADRMRAQGSEVGYHFEELATCAKHMGLRTPQEIEANLEPMRNAFRRNVAFFRDAMGQTPQTVAAHGDFLNRRIGVKSQRMMDRTLLDECGIAAEAHEPWLLRAIDARVSDRPAPVWWYPQSPEKALSASPRVLHILVHPRQWARAPLLNARLDLQRGMEEISYRWRSARRKQ